MRARKVLLLDFDKKDYPELKTVQEFTALIKAKMPQLFIHMIVDSGNGYHCYIAINRTVNIARVAAANKALAEIVGADLKATLITQIARIPTSFNLKDKNNKKPVNIINNALERNTSTFKPYNLARIEGYIERLQQNEINLKKYDDDVQPLPSVQCSKNSSFYCCECMLSQGVSCGARNFTLGRLTKYLQIIKGYTKENALSTLMEWNRRCDPPKSPRIVEEDFDRYWNGNYKLLGCKVADKNDNKILLSFCDKLKCNSVFEPKEGSSTIEAEELFFDNNLLKNVVMRDLTGFHFMILSVLDFVEQPLTKKKLIAYLTGRKTSKCCISKPTLNKVLDDLVRKSYVSYDEIFQSYQINHKTYKPTYTKYSYGATIRLINRIITPAEYLVYLCLVRNLQQNKPVTYEELADNLDKNKENIGQYIKGLHKAGLINVNQSYNERGVLYNTYKIFC